MKRLFSRWTTWLFITVFLFGVSSCLVSRVDRTPYRQTAFYQQFKQELSRLRVDTAFARADTIRAGWAKVNITPPQPMPLAGYGMRKGRIYKSVHDSLWARAFVFDNGVRKAALVTLDLLIVPPALTEALARQLPGTGFTLDQVYLTATHSHHSAGGWAHRLSGWAIAGTYHQAWVDRLAGHIRQAIQGADGAKRHASLGVGTFPAGELVFNRLALGNPTDSLVRVLKIRQDRGATAALVTFSAHATCLHADKSILSRDYPGILVDSLEKSTQIDFAAFCAGAVGSHAPEADGQHFEKASNMGQFLAQKILVDFGRIPVVAETEVAVANLALPLRRPQWRIGENVRLRPWVFYAFFGRYGANLKAMRIGSTVWVGTPCDFSGELVPPLQGQAAPATLFVTSFNGAYIGYITNDACYDRPHYETRDMNWYGPQNGAYLSEAITELLKRL
ncbi:MAG TPA: neutral/alkaline non-lysosomal ceramidase N-terminal domain-containing protein [Cytophagales bacterium]